MFLMISNSAWWARTATFLPCRQLIRWHDWGLYCKLKDTFQTDMTLSKNLQENDAAPHDGLVDPVGVAQEQNLLRLRRWAIFTVVRNV